MRAARLFLILSLLSGCADIAAEIKNGEGHGGGHGDTEPADDDRCLTDWMWIVDGDNLTSNGGGQQTLPISKDGASETGITTSDLEPRAGTRFSLKYRHGLAELYWDGVVVDSFEFDEAFWFSGETKVLSRLEPDGTGAEYHLYTTSSCGPLPPQQVTRAELEAFEP